jgi:hypothetical protein
MQIPKSESNKFSILCTFNLAKKAIANGPSYTHPQSSKIGRGSYADQDISIFAKLLQFYLVAQSLEDFIFSSHFKV